MEQPHSVFTFTPYALDEQRFELSRTGLPVAIHATPLRLLRYLVKNRDRTISKAELLDHVWSDSCVGENALTSAICELRRVLDDDGVGQHWIRTERGRGYRFVAEVEETTFDRACPLHTTVAVLPFVDMSPNAGQEHLANGLTEELIHLLTKVTDLQVVSRTSSFAFKGKADDVRSIGAALRAGTIVEGSLRTSDTVARVTAQVIRATDGCNLWSATYDHTLEDSLALQDEIAREIRGAVQKLLC